VFNFYLGSLEYAKKFTDLLQFVMMAFDDKFTSYYEETKMIVFLEIM